MASSTRLAAASVAALFWLLQGPALSAEPLAPSVSVFDTGAASHTPRSPQSVARKGGWAKLPEDHPAHTFRGDAVLANDRLTAVFRRNASGVELYAHGEQGPLLRAVLRPMAGNVTARLTSVAVVENTPTEAALDAAFQCPDGQRAAVRFELQLGQVFVKTKARGPVDALRLEAPCRFLVMPDFFADDLVVDATELPTGTADLPGENFLLHMVGRGEAVVLAIWDRREDDIQVAVAAGGKGNMFRASRVPYGAEGSVYVALLETPGIWHRRDVAKADADRVLRLDWKPPYPAQWRVDWRQDDGLTDSWEMLLQKPDGQYLKPDWFGQAADYGTDDWSRSDRKRWTTVLGWFQYPCWIDRRGQAFLQPLKKPGNFQGPALVYPLNRVGDTPLAAFTVVDLMRATLGVGPCQYVLDVEGQKKLSAGIPTCDGRTRLNDIYSRGKQVERKVEVERILDDVHAFMRHIRERIEAYVTFGREMRAYLDREKQARPEIADFLSEMETLAGRIDAAVAARKDGIYTPEYATGLVDEFRASLVGYEGGDALKKCKKITAGFVQIGGNQDELVGECRMAVRILRQKAALAMAADPRTAPVANEIRARTQTILRSPTSYEAPRH